MEIWIDTVNLELIQALARLPFFTGVTTNPIILAKAGTFSPKLVHTLLDIQPGPLCLQVTAYTAPEMVVQAKQFREYSDRIIIKVPATQEGYIAIRMLADLHIPTLATAIFQPQQALLAAKAGANYIAPYLSHIANSGADVFATLQSMLTIYRNYNLPTKIMAASLTTLSPLIQCAELGIPAITIKDDLLQELVKDHTQTTEWSKKFAATWSDLILK
jgi:TalC/MipB family fructose-6-phosphate aldolase